jgi:hypothetical protein
MGHRLVAAPETQMSLAEKSMNGRKKDEDRHKDNTPARERRDYDQGRRTTHDKDYEKKSDDVTDWDPPPRRDKEKSK